MYYIRTYNPVRRGRNARLSTILNPKPYTTMSGVGATSGFEQDAGTLFVGDRINTRPRRPARGTHAHTQKRTHTHTQLLSKVSSIEKSFISQTLKQSISARPRWRCVCGGHHPTSRPASRYCCHYCGYKLYIMIIMIIMIMIIMIIMVMVMIMIIVVTKITQGATAWSNQIDA